MATVSAIVSSTLNPDAPLFVPSPVDHTDAVLDFEPEWDVEDFSPEWWTLVQTSPAFREHWLQEFDARNEDDLDALMQLEEADESADLDKEEPEVESPVFSGADIRALVASMKSLEVKMSKSSLKNELLKYHNYKTPKIAPTDMKRSSFRRIQQPR